jgi:nitroreductase
VITDTARLAVMRDAVQSCIDALLMHLDAHARQEVQAYGRYFVRFIDAPVVIAPFFKPMTTLSHLLMSGAPDSAHSDLIARIANLERLSGVVSTSLAIQNLLLAAHAGGLGASCMTGPLIAAPEISAQLEMAGDWRLACLIACGVPDEIPSQPTRKSVSAVTRWFV